jgi:glycerol-3-phosphate acyltransferase PlsY
MLWLLPLAAYLLGSISFAWIAGRIKGIDLRQHGSGNLGATNAGRVLGGRWFAIVFTADLLKGLAPVLAAGWISDHPWLPLATAAAAVLGHVFTCFHGFKGGKAVATSLGVLVGLAPIVAGIAGGAWLLVWLAGWTLFRQTRSSAVGPASILAAAAVVPVHLAITKEPWAGANLALSIFLCLLAGLVLVRHRSNFLKMIGKA